MPCTIVARLTTSPPTALLRSSVASKSASSRTVAAPDRDERRRYDGRQVVGRDPDDARRAGHRRRRIGADRDRDAAVEPEPGDRAAGGHDDRHRIPEPDDVL